MESVKICPNHPSEESPALLVGGICALCNPNIYVKIIDPEILHVIKSIDVIDPPPPCIYKIRRSKIVIFKGLTKSELTVQCSPSRMKVLLQRGDFWADYEKNVKCYVDHNEIFIPHAKNSSDTDPPGNNANEGSQSSPHPHESRDSNAGPSENNDDDAAPQSPTPDDALIERCGLSPEFLKVCRMPVADLFAFAIRDPPPTEFPHTFLSQYCEPILQFINSSSVFRNRQEDSFKLWIWAHSHFVRVKNDESDEKNRKIHDPHVVRKHNTYNFAVPAFNNGLQKTTLEMAISDLGSKFETIHDDMTGSGWAFQRADSIKIVMGRVEHRRIEKTLRDGKGATLKDFIPYHRGWRGSSNVINFDYRNANFRERRDACEDWDKSSPCVMYALKIHSMYHDDKLANRDAIIKNLNNQVHKYYKDETLNAILETRVTSHPTFQIGGFNLRTFLLWSEKTKYQ